MTAPQLRLRFVEDKDSAGVIALIASCYAEYPPNVLDVDGEEPELRQPASKFEAFWVLADVSNRIFGSIALAPHPQRKTVELKKCYVAKSLRGQGWGRRLIERVEAWAREHGYPQVELWTDTRFTLAHQVYAKMGYRRTGRQRELHDRSQTTEDHYCKRL